MPIYVPDALNNREESQGREPCKCLNGWSYRKDWPERASDPRGLRKDPDRAITPAMEAVGVPAHVAPPGSPQAKQLHHLHAQPSLGQSCHRQKSFASMHVGSLGLCPTLCGPVDCGLPGFSVQGFSRQEYWSVLANTGCHILLEHYISCYPSR